MMKEFVAILAASVILIGNAHAGVRSIVSDSSNSDSAVSGDSSSQHSYSYEQQSYEIDAEAMCTSAGFTKHGCPSGERPIGECPYDSGYYAGCCPANYQYLAQDCINAQMKPSSDSCMGYYACEPLSNN